MVIEVRRGNARFVTRATGITTRHSFSFGAHYDPDNVGFGVLAAHNEDVLLPGAGYAEHGHRDVEIVTWVVDGRLRHEDSLAGAVELRPGTVAVTHAGTGIRHTERNASGAEPLRFVQSWLHPGGRGVKSEPSFEVADISELLGTSGWAAAASGLDGWPAPVRLPVPAALLVAGLRPEEQLALDAWPWMHVFVSAGIVEVADVGRLNAGDALRLTGERLALVGVDHAHVMTWIMAG